METSFTYYALLVLGGLVAGGIVGAAFGAIQLAAQSKYELRQQKGKPTNGWVIVPGSFTRVAFLMVALVVVQILLPSFFLSNMQWMVSAGVILGYGWILFQQVRRQRLQRV